MLIHDLRNSLFVSFIKSRGLSNSELRFTDIELRLRCRKIPSPRPPSLISVAQNRIRKLSTIDFPGYTILQILKKNFVNKLNLLKRSSFLSRNALLEMYFKIILPSVLYGLVVWGGCPNTGLLQSLELLHRRAARLIYIKPNNTPTDEVYRHSNWKTLTCYYKLRLIKLFH